MNIALTVIQFLEKGVSVENRKTCVYVCVRERGGETFFVLLVLPRRSILLCLSLVYSFVLGLSFSVFRYCKTINMIKNNNQSIYPNQNYSREKFGNFLAN